MTDKSLHPGLGSGALREALERLIDAGADLRYDEYGVMEMPVGHLATKWDAAKRELEAALKATTSPALSRHACDWCGQDLRGAGFDGHYNIYCHKPECAAHLIIPTCNCDPENMPHRCTDRALSLSSPIEPPRIDKSELTALNRQVERYRMTGENKQLAVPAAILSDMLKEIEQSRAQASSEIREALEQVATYLETLSIEHSPDCSYGATHGPHGDFCDCGLKARRGKRLEVYAVIQAALAPSRQGAGGK